MVFHPPSVGFLGILIPNVTPWQRQRLPLLLFLSLVVYFHKMWLIHGSFYVPGSLNNLVKDFELHTLVLLLQFAIPFLADL
jgi:hypothetical protein